MIKLPSQLALDYFERLWVLEHPRTCLITGQYNPAGSGSLIAATPNGMALIHDANTDYTDFITSTADLPTSDTTVVMWMRRRISGAPATSGISENFGTRMSSATVGSRFGGHIPFTDSKVYWDFGGATEGATRLSAAWTPDDRLHCWAFSTGAQGMQIWIDGELLGSNTANPTRTNTNVSAWGFGRHDRTGGSAGSAVQDVLMVGLTRTQLPSAVAARITRDATLLLQKPTARIYSFPSGAGPSFKAAWARGSNVILSVA